MALTADRDTPEVEGKLFSGPVAAAVHIFAGSLVVRDSSGNLKPGVAATGLIPVGRAAENVDNTSGDAGDLTCEVKAGTFIWTNSGSSALDITDIGNTVYIEDDQTVCKVGTSKSPAGKMVKLDAEGVHVWTDPVQSNDGDLVAANNLSDVANAATARANLGANLIALIIDAVSLIGTGVYRIVSPVAGTITKIQSITDAALATGDATLTGKIGATAITTGVITITQSGSAAGDVDVCSPSAANTVSVGSVISLTVGGTNSAAAGAKAVVLIAT